MRVIGTNLWSLRFVDGVCDKNLKLLFIFSGIKFASRKWIENCYSLMSLCFFFQHRTVFAMSTNLCLSLSNNFIVLMRLVETKLTLLIRLWRMWKFLEVCDSVSSRMNCSLWWKFVQGKFIMRSLSIFSLICFFKNLQFRNTAYTVYIFS